MTLGELWEQFGGRYADADVVFSPNGEEALPVRGAMEFEMEGGETVIYLTNQEGA